MNVKKVALLVGALVIAVITAVMAKNMFAGAGAPEAAAAQVPTGPKILVARKGTVVRSFDPFLGQDYLKTKHLPEEKGLDLENDTGPASWTLLERLTKVHITRDWLMDEGHPAYLVK